MCKLVIVIVALALFGASAIAGTEEDLKNLDTKLANSLEKCLNTSGITDEHLKSLFEGETPLKGKAGCFLACIAKEMGMVKANNMFDKDKINKFLDNFGAKAIEEKIEVPLNETKMVIDTCLGAQKGGDDACVAAKNFGECILTNMDDEGLFSD